MKLFFIISVLSSILLSGCAEDKSVTTIGGADAPTSVVVSSEEGENMYEQITQEEAKKIMDSEDDIVILDVREQDEFDSGHIPGAVLLSYMEIEAKAQDMIPDKNKQILVYCRSGRRSKIAASSLVELGYTNVKEFGGINDWKYDIEK